MALKTNLISWWTLDETSGTRNDSHGTNHLTDMNTVLYGTGKKSNAADFEATNSEYLAITNGSQTGLGITGNWSISAWINLESTPASNATYVIANKKLDGDTGGYWLWYWNDAGTLKFQYGFQNDGSPYNSIKSSTYTCSTATWYHVTVTCTVATEAYALYVNGTAQTVTNISSGVSAPSATTADFRIGSYGTAGSYFDGLIDEVGVWSRALSASEVTELYNSGNGKTYSELSATEILRPTGAGDETGISTVTGAATHWEAVDDTGTGDDATTNISHNVDNTYARDLYQMANSSVGAGTINSVKIYIKHEGTTAYARTVLKTNGTVYESGNLSTAADDTWAYNSTTYTTNPYTGAAWTWAEIDAMQVGVGNYRTPTQQGRITQVYAEVDYTPSGGGGATFIPRISFIM